MRPSIPSQLSVTVTAAARGPYASCGFPDKVLPYGIMWHWHMHLFGYMAMPFVLRQWAPHYEEAVVGVSHRGLLAWRLQPVIAHRQHLPGLVSGCCPDDRGITRVLSHQAPLVPGSRCLCRTLTQCWQKVTSSRQQWSTAYGICCTCGLCMWQVLVLLALVEGVWWMPPLPPSHTTQPDNLSLVHSIVCCAGRCPDSIWHVDHAAVAHESGAEPVLMTCAEAITRHEVKLQHPRLPCIAVLHPPWKHKETAQDRYRTFPLECCW